MDFIERLFSIAPDHGDGATELLYIFAALSIPIAVGFRREITNVFRTFDSADPHRK